MVKFPRVFGHRFIVCSTGFVVGWLISVAVGLCFAAFGVAAFRTHVGLAIFFALVGIAILVVVPRMGIVFGFVSETHFRRGFTLGRPTKIRLDEINEIWPDSMTLTSDAGELIVVRKTAFSVRPETVAWFDERGRDLAELTGAVYRPGPVIPAVDAGPG